MDGPAFSTRAESHMYRSFGAHVIGMTNLPEAKLAREAELPYASIALATDYDCWREGEEEVSVEAVVATLQKNVTLARAIVREAALRIIADPPSDPASQDALRHAIMTAPDRIPEEAFRRLQPIIGRYFPGRVRP
jgi:5'-methylthioadenosine phosphorylase